MLATPRNAPLRKDAGVVLPSVIATLTMVLLFALVSVALVVRSTPASRDAVDEQSATAAAQAGVEEYISRLNANPTYYSINGTGVDATNLAFVARADGSAIGDGRDTRGIRVPGTGTQGARFSYRLLTSAAQTAQTGNIRLQVTGTTDRGVRRSMTASIGQDGYLRFLYFTDVEAQDPALGTAAFATEVDGDNYRCSPDGTCYIYYPDPGEYADKCSRYWYSTPLAAGRAAGFSYTSSAGKPYLRAQPGAPGVRETITTAATVTFTCSEIQFAANDVIAGPAHTNDAMLIGGAATFQNRQTETSWADGASPAPPANRRWRGDGTPLGNLPVYAAPLPIPRSNAGLKAQASVTGQGCLYRGETRIRFSGTSMRVWSPGTTSTTSSACLNVANRANEQEITPIPPVIYVDESTTACTAGAVGYPMANEDTADARTTTDYGCNFGTAYVQGRVDGQVTVATARDVVVTGNLEYADPAAGNDVVGLIPTNYAWVYHPVNSSGQDLLAASARVTRIDAAILSLNRSFLVQNFNTGTTFSATGRPVLTVNGTIAQKFRGPVGTSGGSSFTGYRKNYVYDERLRYLPPPYFLTPEDAPWTVQRITDG